MTLVALLLPASAQLAAPGLPGPAETPGRSPTRPGSSRRVLYLVDGAIISTKAPRAEDLVDHDAGVPMVTLGEHALDVRTTASRSRTP
jgi:hypothetical protein